VAEMRGVIARQKLLQELNTRQASDIAGQVETIPYFLSCRC
jgi:hypothetical protein